MTNIIPLPRELFERVCGALEFYADHSEKGGFYGHMNYKKVAQEVLTSLRACEKQPERTLKDVIRNGADWFWLKVKHPYSEERVWAVARLKWFKNWPWEKERIGVRIIGNQDTQDIEGHINSPAVAIQKPTERKQP